jgi:energy-coupling factor transporter ATP-binding protein EcfA2
VSATAWWAFLAAGIVLMVVLGRSGRKKATPGSWMVLEPLQWFRATSTQLCGLWMFGVGSGAPRIGAPVGIHQTSGVTVACDPISYFRTGLISNPSMFLMGKPGLGKSTLVARMIFALEYFGYHSLILGDLKPDYVDVIKSLGGQIIRLGRGRGHLNVLDHEYAVEWANKHDRIEIRDIDGRIVRVEKRYALPKSVRDEILADAHGRRKNGVMALLNVVRHAPPTERESAILDRALTLLFQDRAPGAVCPVLADLVQLIESRPTELALVAMDRGDADRYLDQVDGLVATLQYLAEGNGLGGIFAKQTDVEMRMDCSVCFDVSSIDHTDEELQAAALLAIWNLGFGKVELQQTLADEGVVKRTNYLVVMDELWRALRLGKGMVDRVDASTRLNRTQGVGLVFITHTLKDLDSVADQADRVKAQGIAERCGIVGLFGLPRAEMEGLDRVVKLSQREQEDVISWSEPGSWDQELNDHRPPPGLGLCLIKVAGRGGLPIRIDLTSEEKELHDTNQRWADAAYQRKQTASV